MRTSPIDGPPSAPKVIEIITPRLQRIREERTRYCTGVKPVKPSSTKVLRLTHSEEGIASARRSSISSEVINRSFFPVRKAS